MAAKKHARKRSGGAAYDGGMNAAGAPSASLSLSSAPLIVHMPLMVHARRCAAKLPEERRRRVVITALRLHGLDDQPHDVGIRVHQLARGGEASLL